MAHTNNCVWFEIPSADFARAVRFYETVFATALNQGGNGPNKIAVFPYAGDASTGCVIHGESYQPAAGGTVPYLAAGPDLEATLTRVGPAGGRVVVSKTPVGADKGFFAQFIDTEGNRVGLFSMQ